MSTIPQGYTLSRATLLNARGLHRFEKEIFPKDAYSTLELVLHMLLPRTNSFIMRDEQGKIAVFGATLDKILRNKHAWIVTIGVAKAHQRRGLGRFILDYCEQQLEANRVKLTVRASNKPAIKLYEATGYRYIKRHYRYYLDGEDGFIMEKTLR